MARLKKRITIRPTLDGWETYKVVKTVNTLDPQISTLIGPNEIHSLIANGIDVTILSAAT